MSEPLLQGNGRVAPASEEECCIRHGGRTTATPALAHHSNYFGHPALRKPAELFKYVPDVFVPRLRAHSDTLRRPKRGSSRSLSGIDLTNRG